ncbi:MAG: hypothetical protein QY322_02175 [bacterium]|nr:MAG: hypothetical protein QY322_02175 [bacterium]
MEKKIQEALKKAKDIINNSEIGDDLRSAGFREVFRLLISSDVDSGKTQLKTESDSGLAAPRTKSKARGKVAGIVDELISNGYFAEKRRDIDCIEQINLVKGIKIPRNQMATILVRKLRSGVLKREKITTGYVYFK